MTGNSISTAEMREKIDRYLAAVGWDDKYYIRYDDMDDKMLYEIICLAEARAARAAG
jgi:hypothetical protein